jgi:hypothetical protein
VVPTPALRRRLGTALHHHLRCADWRELFVGVRQSIFNEYFLPFPEVLSKYARRSRKSAAVVVRSSGGFFSRFLTVATKAFITWILLTVPTVLRTRRMLHNAPAPHDGLGGSVDLLSHILRVDGVTGLFAGNFWPVSSSSFSPLLTRVCYRRQSGSHGVAAVDDPALPRP